MFLEPSENNDTECLLNIFKDPEYESGRIGHRKLTEDFNAGSEMKTESHFYRCSDMEKL
jgi:hypothetical protein